VVVQTVLFTVGEDFIIIYELNAARLEMCDIQHSKIEKKAKTKQHK
jgi:hypothetical protein